MNALATFIADSNSARAAQLRSLLGEAGFECACVQSVEQIGGPADVLFIAGDTPGTAGADDMVERFAQVAPGAPIVVVADAPLWRLINLAVRERAWRDIPKSEKYDDLLTRYATSRSPRPKIIIEDNAARCASLLAEWEESPQHMTDARLLHNVEEALELAISGEAPVLLNRDIPPGILKMTNISVLIYALCPAVIAVMTEAYNPRYTYQNFVCTEPHSRFAVLKSPFRSSELKLLLTHMDVSWPVTSPL